MSLKKMISNNGKRSKSVALSLVSLMDVFTVLVFFLLFNVHDDQKLKVSEQLLLPSSNVAVEDVNKTKDIVYLNVISKGHFSITNGNDKTNVTMSDINSKLLEIFNSNDAPPALAISAPKTMDYQYVNKFVELANNIGFDGVYLVVRKIS